MAFMRSGRFSVMSATCGRGCSTRTYVIALAHRRGSGGSQIRSSPCVTGRGYAASPATGAWPRWTGAACAACSEELSALAADLLVHGDVRPAVEYPAGEAEELLHRLARAVRREGRLVGVDL